MRVEMSSTAFMLEIVPTFATVVNNSNDHVLPQGAQRATCGARSRLAGEATLWSDKLDMHGLGYQLDAQGCAYSAYGVEAWLCIRTQRLV